MMRARFPLLLLLGIVFLASVSVSLSIAPKKLCVQRCNRLQQCKLHCKPEEEEGGGKRPQPPHQPEDEDEPEQSPSYPHQQRPYPKKHQEKDQPRPYPQPPHKKDLEDEQDAEDEPRPYPYPQPPHKKDPEDEQDAEDEPRPYPYPPHQQQSEEDDDDDEYSQQSKKRPNNPYYFSSNNFPTYFKNQYGRIRLLQKFNKHSPQQLQNLREYRLIELLSKPNTLLLPHHADADYLILILSGRAILTLLYPNDSESFHLQRGDALKISSGTTYYVINPDDNENLKLLTFALPVNKPGSLETFFLSSTQVQQSYLQGFSKNILEASYDTQHEEIKSVLFGEEEQQQQQQGEREQNREEGLIVELSKEQIRALSKHAKAKSSSRKTISSEDKPFNLKSNEPIYSNKFGKFYEITPEKNPQLRDLDMFLSFVDMNEGALLLPHYNSKAIVILVVNKGQGKIQLVGLKEQQKQRRREVQRYEAELSENDIYVVPAAYPVAINATSNLNLFAFGINAENNKRNFLAGEKENVISEIPSEVQELTFPGSAKEVEKVITKQKDSYFVDGQPEQNEEGSKGRKGPLSSILTAFY